MNIFTAGSYFMLCVLLIVDDKESKRLAGYTYLVIGVLYAFYLVGVSQ